MHEGRAGGELVKDFARPWGEGAGGVSREQLHSSATRDLLGHIAQYVRCHAVLASRAAADAKAAAALKASRGPPPPCVMLGLGGV